jgi:hypothetical protein
MYGPGGGRDRGIGDEPVRRSRVRSIGRLRTGHVFLQVRNDLPFGVPLAHRLVFSSGPDSNSTRIEARGQHRPESRASGSYIDMTAFPSKLDGGVCRKAGKLRRRSAHAARNDRLCGGAQCLVRLLHRRHPIRADV